MACHPPRPSGKTTVLLLCALGASLLGGCVAQSAGNEGRPAALHDGRLQVGQGGAASEPELPTTFTWDVRQPGPFAFGLTVASDAACRILVQGAVPHHHDVPVVWRDTGMGMGSRMADVEGPGSPPATGASLAGRLYHSGSYVDWKELDLIVAFPDVVPHPDLDGAAARVEVECPQQAKLKAQASRQVFAGGPDSLGCMASATVVLVQQACVDGHWEGNLSGTVRWHSLRSPAAQDWLFEFPGGQRHYTTQGMLDREPLPELAAGRYAITMEHFVTVPTPVSVAGFLLAGMQPVGIPVDLDTLPQL